MDTLITVILHGPAPVSSHNVFSPYRCSITASCDAVKNSLGIFSPACSMHHNKFKLYRSATAIFIILLFFFLFSSALSQNACRFESLDLSTFSSAKVGFNNNVKFFTYSYALFLVLRKKKKKKNMYIMTTKILYRLEFKEKANIFCFLFILFLFIFFFLLFLPSSFLTLNIVTLLLTLSFFLS